MTTHISIEEFVHKLYPPVGRLGSMNAKGIIKRLHGAGITDLDTLIRTSPKELRAIRRIGPLFIAHVNEHLANIGCHLGMTDDEVKHVILSRL